jgi:hypothetical protein
MYPWDNPADSVPAPRLPEPAPRRETPVEPAIRAVQVALDRRDNGGDVAGAVGAVGQPETRPAGRPTRQ